MTGIVSGGGTVVGVVLPGSTLSDQPLQCRFGDRLVPATPVAPTPSTPSNNNNNNAPTTRSIVCLSPVLDDLDDPTPTSPPSTPTIDFTITTMDGEILSPSTPLTLLRPPPVIHLEPLFVVLSPTAGLGVSPGASSGSVAFTVMMGVALDQVGLMTHNTIRLYPFVVPL